MLGDEEKCLINYSEAYKFFLAINDIFSLIVKGKFNYHDIQITELKLNKC